MSEEMPKRIELVYQDAVENLRFFKQQQWTVTNYAFLTYAALIALAQLTEASKDLLLVAVWLVFVYSVFVLASFMWSIGKFRRRVKWIYGKFFPK
jgi:hypothetical protein